MSFFLRNVCKFEGCGEMFESLSDLIEHIETGGHIDFNPEVVQQFETGSPESIPLSYAVRYSSTSTDLIKPDDPFCSLLPDGVANEHNYCLPLRQIGSDSEIDDFDAVDAVDVFEDDPDEEFSSDFIMRYGSMQASDGGSGKPFACPVPGCKKRYKNINGIKYHAKNGHKRNKSNKGLVCYCGKVYKTENGLKNHAAMAHGYAKVILPRSNVSVFRQLESVAFLTINKIPSPIDGMCESNGGDYCMDKSNNETDLGSTNLQAEGGLASSQAISTLEEKSEVTNKLAVVESPKKSNHTDDIIDVGDVSDCVYP